MIKLSNRQPDNNVTNGILSHYLILLLKKNGIDDNECLNEVYAIEDGINQAFDFLENKINELKEEIKELKHDKNTYVEDGEEKTIGDEWDDYGFDYRPNF
jgi:hypothetical protein